MFLEILFLERSTARIPCQPSQLNKKEADTILYKWNKIMKHFYQNPMNCVISKADLEKGWGQCVKVFCCFLRIVFYAVESFFYLREKNYLKWLSASITPFFSITSLVYLCWYKFSNTLNGSITEQYAWFFSWFSLHLCGANCGPAERWNCWVLKPWNKLSN